MVFPGSAENPIQADIKIKIHQNKPAPLHNLLRNLGFVWRRICGRLKAAPCITQTQIPFTLRKTPQIPSLFPQAAKSPCQWCLRAWCQPPHSQGWAGTGGSPPGINSFSLWKNDPRESHGHLLQESHLFPARLFPPGHGASRGGGKGWELSSTSGFAPLLRLHLHSPAGARWAGR